MVSEDTTVGDELQNASLLCYISAVQRGGPHGVEAICVLEWAQRYQAAQS